MTSKISLFIILTFMLFSLTGCYDATAIESSYYIVAIGIDKGTSNLYNISIQIAKNESSSSASGSSQSSNSEIYQVECRTFDSRY